jgi:hypothetical protein
MAGPSALVVNMRFNPPEVEFVGPILESTVLKLNTLLPSLTSLASRGRHAPPTFQFLPPTAEQPRAVWRLELTGYIAHDTAQLAMMGAVVAAVEEEELWDMHDGVAWSTDGVDHHTLFFVRKPKRKIV